MALGFSYNHADQIVGNSRSNDLYSFAGLANASRADTHNGRNQIVTTAGTAVTHDSRGNITNDGSRAYGYSSENLLTSASGGWSLGYDPLMRLLQVTDGTSTVRFAYDGIDMVAEFNTAGTLLRRHVPGPGIDEPLLTYEGAGTSDRRFLHADERGSIVAHSNFFGDGQVIQVNRYDEYGVPAATNAGRFGYTGQAWLAQIGLSYYRARMYHPGLGRFMQPDPIGYAAGMCLSPYRAHHMC